MKDLLRQTSEKKQALIDAKNASPLVVGEKITVLENKVSYYVSEERADKTCSVKVVKVNKLTLVVEVTEYRSKPEKYKISKKDVLGRSIGNLGANPFNSKYDSVRPVAFSLDSILFSLNILGNKRIDNDYEMSGVKVKKLNWMPYVYDASGDKQYYQRDFCWSLKDKQLLIESIYNGIDCGKILIRMRGWGTLEAMAKKGETDLAFRDIVDGKQRLEAIRGFIMNEYPDLHGNYYDDLSFISQNSFTNHQLFSYAEMNEKTSDDETIYQFLKMNFTGVPQSQEHLDYVKEISDKL